MALPLNAIPHDELAPLGMENGRAKLLPATSTSAFIEPGNVLVLVGPDRNDAGYSPLAQYAFCVAAGRTEVEAGLLAGIRLGLINAILATRYVLAGTSIEDIQAMLAERVDILRPVADEAAAQAIDRRLHLNFPADAAGMEALYRAGFKTTGPASTRISAASVPSPMLNIRYRAGEAMLVPVDYDVTLAIFESFKDKSGIAYRAYQEGASFAVNALFLIVLHLHKSEGHHWMSKPDANVCFNAFTKVCRGAKTAVKQATYMKILHDVLHPFEGLSELFNTIFAMPLLDMWVNDSVMWRYPPTISGAAVLTASQALVVEIRNMLGMHQAPAGSLTIFNEIADAVHRMVNDLELNSVSWAVRAGPNREKRNQKLSAAKELAAYLKGFATGLKIEDEATVMNATSITNAASAFPARAALGNMQAEIIQQTSAPASQTMATTGLDQVLLNLEAAW